MLIQSTNLANARLMDFFQVMRMTADFLGKEDLEALKLKPYADAFLEALEKMDAALIQAQKTGYTEQIIAADDARDNILTGMLVSLRGMLRFPDPAISEAAAALKIIADKYGVGIARLPQREETAVLLNLIQDFGTEENSRHVAQAGLTAWVEKLAEANQLFDTLYNARTEKESEFIVGLTRTERANMQTAFETLCRAIDAYAFIEEAEKYTALAEKINTEVATVQEAAKARATLAKRP